MMISELHCQFPKKGISNFRSHFATSILDLKFIFHTRVYGPAGDHAFECPNTSPAKTTWLFVDVSGSPLPRPEVKFYEGTGGSKI